MDSHRDCSSLVRLYPFGWLTNCKLPLRVFQGSGSRGECILNAAAVNLSKSNVYKEPIKLLLVCNCSLDWELGAETIFKSEPLMHWFYPPGKYNNVY